MRTFPTLQCFLFCLDIELFAENMGYLQIIKRPGFYTLSEASFFIFLLITQDLNKIKSNPKYPSGYIVKKEICSKFQQKPLNYTAVGARQSFQFSRQITWFLENNRALSFVCVLNYLFSIIKL